MTGPKTIALALGSGGARGYAHVGVLRWIEEHDLEVQAIAGSSMGALVGGVFAAGSLDEFEDWASSIRKSDVLGLVDVVLGRSGLVAGERAMKAIAEFIGDRPVEDLPVPFTAVAVELDSNRERWMQSGPLFDAIRASISIPLFFVPHEVEGRELLDGGILNPVPVAPLASAEADLVVAVNLTGPEDRERRGKPPTAEAENGESRGRVRRVFDRILDGIGDRLRSNGDEPSMLRTATSVVDAMQGSIARVKLAAHPPDVEIQIPRNAAQVLEFDRAQELVRVGYEAAEAQLGPRIRRDVDGVAH